MTDSPDVHGWKPISTAPKDGTHLLCYWKWQVPEGLDAYDVACWHAGYWRDSVDDEGHWGEPTHWMPLPAPPVLP